MGYLNRVVDALDFYSQRFKRIEVPWAVSREAIAITRPQVVAPMYVSGGKELYPVGSAEQSFIQMKMDNPNGFTGKYVAFSPCFRSEEYLDETRLPYFCKVELGIFDNGVNDRNLDYVMHYALEFFSRYLKDVQIVLNGEEDPIAVCPSYDIVSKDGIELGSYGIRYHPKVGRWVYGTGLAEPRLSYCLGKE